MNNSSEQQQKPKRSSIPLIIAIAIILVVIIGWHLLFPILGITLAVTAAAWGVLLATIAVLSIVIILFFVFSGAGILILGLFAFIGALLAITFFPIIFPLVVPLLVILLFIGFLVRRRR